MSFKQLAEQRIFLNKGEYNLVPVDVVDKVLNTHDMFLRLTKAYLDALKKYNKTNLLYKGEKGFAHIIRRDYDVMWRAEMDLERFLESLDE